jgi:hypothetical protein
MDERFGDYVRSEMGTVCRINLRISRCTSVQVSLIL